MASAELKELESIKRLAVLLLLKLGASSEEIGTALNVDSSAIRRTFGVRKIKKIQFGS